jgi:hypothetical protein
MPIYTIIDNEHDCIGKTIKDISIDDSLIITFTDGTFIHATYTAYDESVSVSIERKVKTLEWYNTYEQRMLGLTEIEIKNFNDERDKQRVENAKEMRRRSFEELKKEFEQEGQ